jgi:acetyltransferase-like isoleucine patch superfamily enzyme
VSALSEIGIGRAIRYLLMTLAALPLRIALFPQPRALWLRVLGARVGSGAIVHGVRFFNLYRRGFAGLEIGERAFVGDDCLLDLAEGIVLERNVTLAERVVVLTHLNVGYADHPLQAHFPPQAAPVTIREGSFVGASVTILAGVTVGPCAFVAAGSVVTKDVEPWTVVAGVPARAVKALR